MKRLLALGVALLGFGAVSVVTAHAAVPPPPHCVVQPTPYPHLVCTF